VPPPQLASRARTRMLLDKVPSPILIEFFDIKLMNLLLLI
jgi:hypothetical protein